MAAILIFFIISSLKPYVGLSCNFVEDIGTIWILRFARFMHSYFSSRLLIISLIKVIDFGPLNRMSNNLYSDLSLRLDLGPNCYLSIPPP